MAWVYALYFVVALVISYSLTPKPQNAKPAGLDEIQVPTAEVGREIPVLFGTREGSRVQLRRYGDLRTVPVKKSGGKK